MLKIGQIGRNIQKEFVRYNGKKTIASRYQRCKNRADWCAIGTAVEIMRFPSWTIADIPIVSFLGSLSIKSYEDAFSLRKSFKAIEKRAKAIKKLPK